MKKTVIFMTAIILTAAVGCGKKAESETVGGYRYANLGDNVYADGMLYMADNTQRYLSFANMENAALCSKPNCDHRSSECVGKVVGECPIIYGDYIYFFRSSTKTEEIGNGKREFKINSKLCRVSMDSSEVEELTEFHDCVPRDYDGWIIDKNMVWFTGDDMNPIEDEFGNITTGNQGGTHYFCGIDLKTNSYTNYGSVYDGDKEFEAAANSSSAQIKGMYDGKIMIRYEFAREYPPEKIEEGFDFRSLLAELMFEFDPKTKTLTESALIDPAYVEEDTYIYTKGGTAHVMYKGVNYEFPSDSWLNMGFVNGKMFDYTAGKWFDTADMSEHDMGEYSGYRPYAFYDGCYILGRNKDFVKLTEDELLALKN